MSSSRIGRRVAIVEGVRTPFAKSGTALKSLSAIELGRLCVAELVQRTNLERRVGRRPGLRDGGAVSARPEHRARNLPHVAAPQGSAGVVGLPRLRQREPGDHRRGRPDRPRTRRRDHRRWRRVALECPHPAFAWLLRRAGCRVSRQVALAARAGARPHPAARPRPGDSRDRRANDGRDDGTERREDGQDQRDLAGSAGPLRPAARIARRALERPTDASRRRSPRSGCRRATTRRSIATTASGTTRRSRRSRRSSRSSIGGTGA